jgi:CRISPR-associated protein Csd2
MSPVRCIAFRHEKKTGDARADQLFSQVSVDLRPEVAAENRPPRSRNDYSIELKGDLPVGVTAEYWV